MHNTRTRPALSGNVVAAAFLSFPAVFFCLLVLLHAANVPLLDDYDTILEQLSIPGIADRLAHVFAQHNEHRIAFNLGVAEFLRFACGRIDFRLLIYVGNTSLLVFFAMFFRQFRRLDLKLWYFLPVPCLLFNLGAWENMTWATSALQNNFVNLFAFLSFYFWSRPGRTGIAAAVLSGTLAAYTSASGLLVLPLLLVAECCRAAFSSDRRKETVLRVGGLLLWTAGIIAVYFAGYHAPARHPDAFRALAAPLSVINFTVLLLGAPFQMFGTPVVYSAGAGLLLLFGYLTVTRYDRDNPVLYFFLLFLLASAAMIALGRSGFSARWAYISRYRIIPLLALAVGYLSLLQRFKRFFEGRRAVMGIAAAGGAVLYVLSIVAGGPALRTRQVLIAASLDPAQNPDGTLPFPDQARAHAILREAAQAGCYILPASTDPGG